MSASSPSSTRTRTESVLQQGDWPAAYAELPRTPTAIEDCVLACWLIAELSSTTTAAEQAKVLLKNCRSDEQRALMCLVIALDDLRHFRLASGLKHLQAAREHAARQSRSFESRVLGRGVAAIADWGVAQPSAGLLTELRHLALATGSQDGLVAFHYVRAIGALRLGRHKEASRHIHQGRQHLGDPPNRFWSGKFANTAAALHGYQGRLQEALVEIEIARSHSDGRALAAVNGNLAQLTLLAGNVAACDEAIVAAGEFLATGGNSEVALADTAMQLALARGDLSKAASIADKSRLQFDPARIDQALWTDLTTCRLALFAGDPSGASAFALSSLPRIRRSGDGNLLPRMQLLAAEALALEGKPREASAMLLEASDSAVRPGLDVVGELWRVAGRIAPRTPLARAHFDRAHRVLTDIGYLTPAAEVSRQADSAGLPDDSVPLTPRDAGARMLHGLSAVVDAIGRPEVAGRELLHLLLTTDAVRSGAVIRRREQTEVALHRADSVTEDASSTAPVTIPLGADEESEYRLDVDMVQTTSAATTVMAARRLAGSARDLQRLREQERESSPLWPDSTPDVQLGVVVGSEAMRSVLALVRRVATSPVTVLITGETGTGKEVLARALHEASLRKDRPFVPFNCSAVAKDMLDAQLFGYRRGAFTGAQEAFPGVIRAASGGTLFLDEIGEVSLEVQPKLLRFLESGDVHPLGEPRPVAADVRVVAATNADLEALVADGRFREDLYYRLHVVRVVVPPLRERREEIPLLVRYWLTRFGDEFHKPDVRLADDTLEFLTLYAWPGNVRELTNEVRRLVALAESGAVLMPEHLSPRIAASRRTRPSSEGELTPDELVVRTDQPMAATIAHVERTMIQQALARCSGRVEDAARLLGLSRKGLYLKRQRYGID